LLVASVAGLLAYGVRTLVGDGGRVSAFFDNEVYYGLLFAAIALCTLLSAAPVLQQVAALVRSTPEHWDGTGYPDGLVGDAIPLTARIVAASDAYTAMRETRA
jgi:hypothetical protein